MPSPTSRPNPLRTTRSFTQSQNDDPLSMPRPKRASTIQNGVLPKITTTSITSQIMEEPESATLDTFENNEGGDDEAPEPPRTSVDLDDLPIELISLTDSFIGSLSARTYANPPNIDNVSRLFQDFYGQAAQHINTHINSLLTRHRRESSPAASMSSRASATSLLRAKAAAIGGKDKKSGASKAETPEQQMITADEMADRKKIRKALEQQRGTLEEAAERRLCEGMYAKIYRHQSTQDEAADDMLRSKTAALAVVGIGLTDLGVQLTEPSEPPEAQAQKAEEVREWLDGARKELIAMNDSRYPLGKLNHLKSAHKGIVDTLSHFHPSSSADEIMPMLIYTLITLPPASLNVISDLRFIERFRWEPKLVGEAAYCLTNLEAAISFLETVDLSTLRSDEAPSGPLRSISTLGMPADTFPPAYTPGVTASSTAVEQLDGSSASGLLKPTPSPGSKLKEAQLARNRRISDLVNTPAQALGAASDAMRNTADVGLKTISNSLGDSYKFLLGKLREPAGSGEEVVVPKTLEDARKLIGTPPPEDDSSINSLMNPDDNEVKGRQPHREDRMLNLIAGGRKPSAVREHSADSSRSAGSSTKRLSAVFGDDKEKSSTPASGTPTGAGPNPALMESMRNLGSSLNPMAKLAGGIGSFRPFARTPSQPVTPQAHAPPTKIGDAEGVDLATAFPDIAANLPPKEVPKIKPPNKRFMEMQNPADLRIGEVLELLRDYRRLAGALKDRGAFKE
ncbi:Vacuolar protein sorting-associated protein 9b [Cytospora mali]|uniref:Vacuolar protein sorting-associated protein 9b n=1 Tax=Cytospora mali TaxID=578113 RepID=A0A194VN42_CYTMA|nr:Vacuolar protein sorting-associated protein 9b [Valsa mali]